MAQTTQLTHLATRRRLLVARSTELREECSADLVRLRSFSTWVETGFLTLRSGRAVLPMLTTVAGLVSRRNRQGLLGKAVRLASWVGLGKRVAGILRSFSSTGQSGS